MTPTSDDPGKLGVPYDLWSSKAHVVDPSIAGAPINSLPDELLVTIFQLALQAEKYVDRRRASRSRTAMALVSRDWCRVIYHTPSFWRTIQGGLSDAQIDLALQTSEQAPLDVRFNDPNFTMGALQKVCNHIHRWRTAWISVTFGRPWVHLTDPAPLLTDLSLIGPVFGGEVPADELFQGQTPQLTSFRLIHHSIPWTGSLFSGLTTLCLMEIRERPPRIAELIAILQACPHLEDLTLDSIRLQPPESTTDPIPLLHLRNLKLSFLPLKTTRDLLSAIQCPPCQSFALICGVRSEEDLVQLSHLNFARFLPPTPPDGFARLTAGVASFSFAVDHPTHTCEIQIVYYAIGPILLSIIPLFPSPYLSLETELVLAPDGSGSPFNNTDPIVDLIKRTNINITRVHINITDFGAALFVQRLGEREDGRWNLPNLRNLSLDLRGASRTALVTMIKARYGVEPRTAELPVPLTRLAIKKAPGYQRDEFTGIREFVGAGCLVLDDDEHQGPRGRGRDSEYGSGLESWSYQFH